MAFVFRGLIGGGPLTAAAWRGDYFVMMQPGPTVTCCVGPRGLRVLPGHQFGASGEYATEYGWVWGVWLHGEELALARLAADAAV